MNWLQIIYSKWPKNMLLHPNRQKKNIENVYLYVFTIAQNNHTMLDFYLQLSLATSRKK